MPTNYPAGDDVFNVPSSPSTTPLSSAGTGTRNHVTHHQDLGDAIMAIQQNVTKTSHSHDGTGRNGPKLLQANTHQSPDTDSGPSALHHTLGATANQAAPGNHTHPQYVDLSSAQSIVGKKTFPSGAGAPAIPDFTNANHGHRNPATGGMVASPMSYFTVNKSYLDPGVNERVNLLGAPFQIPSGMILIGETYVYIGAWDPANKDNWKAMLSVSYGAPGVTYSDNENITIIGGTYKNRTGSFIEASGENKVYVVPYYVPWNNIVNKPTNVLKLNVNNTMNTSVMFYAHNRFWITPYTSTLASGWMSMGF